MKSIIAFVLIVSNSDDFSTEFHGEAVSFSTTSIFCKVIYGHEILLTDITVLRKAIRYNSESTYESHESVQYDGKYADQSDENRTMHCMCGRAKPFIIYFMKKKVFFLFPYVDVIFCGKETWHSILSITEHKSKGTCGEYTPTRE